MYSRLESSERKKFHSLELDLHSFWRISFFCFLLFAPGSNRSQLRAMRADVSYVTVCCVWYTVTRHAQTRTWGVQSQLQLRVLFSADLWMGKKNSKFERLNRTHTKPLVMDFPIHSFFERNLQYIYDHVIYAYNLRVLK